MSARHLQIKFFLPATIMFLSLTSLGIKSSYAHDNGNKKAGTINSDYDIFADLWIPNGLEFTGSGDLLVLHFDASTNGYLSEYAETGQLLESTQMGEVMGYLTREPQSGTIFWLCNDSLFYTLDPVSKAKTLLFNIHDLDISLKTVYDVHWDRISNYGSLINLKYCSYGDFVVHQLPDAKDVFICGIAQLNTIPFILKIRLSAENEPLQALVLMASDIASELEHPRGIALNNEGTLLTTFPEQSGVWPYQNISEIPVTFSTGFNPTDGVQNDEKPEEPFPPGGVDICSQGMCCDNSGNFYIVTSSYGASVADSLFPGGNLSSGCLLVLPPSLKPIQQIYFPPELMLVNFVDVAVNPQNTKAYITISEWKEDIFDFNPKSGRVITYPVEATAVKPPIREDVMPSGFQLYQNYPNPFNPETTLSFFLPAAHQVKLTIYNPLGEMTTVLLDRYLPNGLHKVVWHPSPSMSAGIYFYRMEAAHFVSTGKMIYLK